jgi:Fur family transcriptional regulator, ferric uptake regulator
MSGRGVVPQEWDRKLRAKGYRVTPQRRLVLEAVSKLRHATPDEILLAVQQVSPAVNLSTVYRTLEVLEDVGLVSHAHIDHGAPTYHAIDGHQHVHLVCARCGKVESISADIISDLVDRMAKETGFVTDVSHLAVHGTCRDCLATDER